MISGLLEPFVLPFFSAWIPWGDDLWVTGAFCVLPFYFSMDPLRGWPLGYWSLLCPPLLLQHGSLEGMTSGLYCTAPFVYFPFTSAWIPNKRIGKNPDLAQRSGPFNSSPHPRVKSNNTVGQWIQEQNYPFPRIWILQKNNDILFWSPCPIGYGSYNTTMKPSLRIQIPSPSIQQLYPRIQILLWNNESLLMDLDLTIGLSIPVQDSGYYNRTMNPCPRLWILQ